MGTDNDLVVASGERDGGGDGGVTTNGHPGVIRNHEPRRVRLRKETEEPR